MLPDLASVAVKHSINYGQLFSTVGSIIGGTAVIVGVAARMLVTRQQKHEADIKAAVKKAQKKAARKAAQQAAKLEEVRENVDGHLTKTDDRVAELTAVIEGLGGTVPPAPRTNK
jgi:mannitol-specific phosphotransferase system IIBC component